MFPTVYTYSYIQSLNSFVSSITIPDWTCNDIDYTIFDFSRFINVESIEIGDNCFGSVQTFLIDGLNRLKTIKIGNKSFTQHQNDYRYDKSRSFHILNCESLESIQIGEYSFSVFAGEFELKNLPKLQTIHIGNIRNNDAFGFFRHQRDLDSNNFFESSFVIRGIVMILNIVMVRSSKSAIHYIR